MSFSMLPFLSGNSWWDCLDYPPRIADQDFGMGILDSDLLPPITHRGYVIRPRTRMNLDRSGQSEVKNEANKFVVKLNVKQFKPVEIEVKTVDKSIVIHGKHEEKVDEHGFISREFTRRYMMPEGTEPETVKSTFSSNGVLIVEAPKKAIEQPPRNERIVPITVQEAMGDH